MSNEAILLGAAALILGLLVLLWRFWAERLRRFEADNRRLGEEVSELKLKLERRTRPSKSTRAVVRRLVMLCQRDLERARPRPEQVEAYDQITRQLVAELAFLLAEREAHQKGNPETLRHFGALARDVMEELEEDGATEWGDPALLEPYLDKEITVLQAPFHATRIEQLLRQFERRQVSSLVDRLRMIFARKAETRDTEPGAVHE